MRVLILSCGTGGGHNAAASAMKEALEARGHSADVLNPYTLKTNKLAKIIDVVYVRLVQISPTLFGCVYKIGDAYRRLPWRSPVYFVNAQMVPVMDKYLKENKFRLREEVGTTADFYKGTNQDYIVHCEVRENKAVLIGLDLSVPDKEQAEAVCGAWRRKSQEIYSHVMHTLLS